jgi:hypothetical protein
MGSDLHTLFRRWLTGTHLLTEVLLAVLFAFAMTVLTQAEPVKGGSKLKVMTYNVYAGTQYAGATDPSLAVFRQAMTNVVLDVRASDPEGRAQALARQIVNYSPHLVSLQEVFTVSTGPSKDELTLEFDYLQLLLQALAEQGAYYTPVESVQTWESTVPTTSGYLRDAWRIVILARADLNPESFHLTNVDGDKFLSTIVYPLPALDNSADCPVALTGTLCLMAWPRGWAYADVSYRGEQFRFVNTTLESHSNSKNNAQGFELLSGALNTGLPVILAGDLNCDMSNSLDRKCDKFIDAGLLDAWNEVNPGEPGFTKELPTMSMRSDYVMLRDLSHAEAVALVGEEPADKTTSGQWGSNHAGVVAKLDRPE